MFKNIEWGQLHDATLKTITVSWQDSLVRLEFITSDGPNHVVSIAAIGVSKVIIPHEKPWGDSVSVNEIRLLQSPTKEGIQLEIEMQSGDTILIEAIQLQAK